MNKHLNQTIANLPQKPGIYIYKDSSGEVLYVGKSKRLRSRVQSYFRKSSGLDEYKQEMIPRITELEYIITDSETEALLLEATYIKRFRPQYNVWLRDDKYYKYIKIHSTDDFPRITQVRQVTKDGGIYFGPYVNAMAVNRTIKILRSVFPFRTSEKEIFEGSKQDHRPCFNYHIRRCLGPCAGHVSKDDYAHLIKKVVMFLRGEHADIIKALKIDMKNAAGARRFELAARVRDQISSLKHIAERQKVISNKFEDQDFISIYSPKGETLAYVNLFQVRSGNLFDKQNFILQSGFRTPRQQLIASFIKNYYRASVYVPKEIYIEEAIDEKDLYQRTLTKIYRDNIINQPYGKQKSRGSVQIGVARIGRKKKLLVLSLKNAKEFAHKSKAAWEKKQAESQRILSSLQETMKLTDLPERIECYDISNTQGKLAVGSMVVYENAQANNEDYRKFRVKISGEPNDVGMITEVLGRRLKKLNEEGSDQSFSKTPNLILIDGGKAQLSAVSNLVRSNQVREIAFAAISKKEEIVILDNKGNYKEIHLPPTTDSSHLLQRIRDAAHRFALGYHSDLKKKFQKKSALDQIKGIGPTRKKALIKKFGTLENIRQAKQKELAETIGQKASKNLRDQL